MRGSGGWYRTEKIGEGITLVTEPFVNPFFSANMYLVRGRDADLLVDTGMGLAPLAPALSLVAGKPLIAVATHIHVDHVGALHEFPERAGPKQSAAGFETMPDRLTYADMFRVLDEPVSRPPRAGWSATAYALKPATLVRPLAEGDVIELGDRRFGVLELPGHAPDQIGLFSEGEGLFFSGDAIYDDQLIDDLPDSDRAAYRRTMTRLLGLPVRKAFGGHGPGFDGRRMRWIAERYLATTAG